MEYAKIAFASLVGSAMADRRGACALEMATTSHDVDMLQKFNDEVLVRGGMACLPRSLSDEWLEIVAQSVEDMLEGMEDGSAPISLAAILCILMAKNGTGQCVISEEELHLRFQTYGMELGFEAVHRKTDMQYEAATLATIFTNRSVKTWRKTG